MLSGLKSTSEAGKIKSVANLVSVQKIGSQSVRATKSKMELDRQVKSDKNKCLEGNSKNYIDNLAEDCWLWAGKYREWQIKGIEGQVL